MVNAMPIGIQLRQRSTDDPQPGGHYDSDQQVWVGENGQPSYRVRMGTVTKCGSGQMAVTDD